MLDSFSILSGGLKYLKNLVLHKDVHPKYQWISILILFKDNNRLVIDKAYILKSPNDLGSNNDLESSNYGFYCQFNHFVIINGELHYHYPDKLKKINSKDVYLHVRV